MKNYSYDKPKELAYVYIISDNNDHIKVGISKDPEKRLKQLQTGQPNELRILFTEEFYCKRSHLLKIENLIHKQIRTLIPNISGEWFTILPDNLNEIQNIITLARIYYEENEVAFKFGTLKSIF